jgi:hypothetical protein
MLNRKACVLSMASGFLLFCSAGLLLALNADYNRPNPLLDYAPQEMGMYDTRYDELGEMDCRACHGDSLVDRHHYSPRALEHQTCGIESGGCHELIPEPPGVVIIRDCTTSSCHSWDDVLAGNGWHHATDLSLAENCVICHNPNLVGPIGPFLPFVQYPPSVVTPTPFSCENCHWEQVVVASAPGFDPDTSPPSDAGHPSTYDHYDPWGNFLGYHEYGSAILGNFDTHHMGFRDDFAAQCGECHGTSPEYPVWAPYDSELIRYCTRCHDDLTLHVIHLADYHGWEAVGFHAGGGDGAPDDYRPIPALEMCWPCHEDVPPADFRPCSPAIHMITPGAGCLGSLVELWGECFGESQGEGKRVEIMKRSDGLEWIELPIYSWSDTRIVFQLTSSWMWGLPYGTYRVRVHNEEGYTPNSNEVVLTLKDSGDAWISPASAPCERTIRLFDYHASRFGEAAQDTISSAGADDGVYRFVELVSSQGNYEVLSVKNWQSNAITLTLKDLYLDAEPRNYLQDASEATISGCSSLVPDRYEVYVRYVFYEDDDSSASFTPGDTVLESNVSTPFFLQLTNEPFISKVQPQPCPNRSKLRLKGINFGDIQTDGQVRIGKRAEAEDPAFGKGKLLDRVKHWSDTKVVTKLNVKGEWEGKNRFVWIEKDGMKSNYKRIEILTPSP